MAVVTFSREAHSGTQDLARLVATELGYRYIRRDELTAAVNARSGLDRTPQTAESEGRALNLLEQLGEHLSGERTTYRSALKAVVTELAASDNVVIVGHGAGLFLRDLRTAVRVFVVAPTEDRLARLVAEGTEPDKAPRLLEQQDRESADYLRDLFGVDWRDPHNWDLVINTGTADLQAVVDMIVQYTRSLVRDQAERATLTQLDLVNRIEHALLSRDDLGVSGLRVRFEAERLVLEGRALAAEDRELVESVAVQLAPEAAIDNQIVVRPPSAI